MEQLATISFSLYVIFWAFAFLMAVLWFLLPFAVFGTKDLLRNIEAQNRQTISLLVSIDSSLSKLTNELEPQQVQDETIRNRPHKKLISRCKACGETINEGDTECQVCGERLR